MSSIDLVILGIVLEKPQSAYDIQKDVEYHHLSRWTKISIPSIYQKVLQLHEKGYLRSDVVKGDRFADKAVCSITEQGRAYFKELMSSCAAGPVPFYLISIWSLPIWTRWTKPKQWSWFRLYARAYNPRLSWIRAAHRNLQTFLWWGKPFLNSGKCFTALSWNDWTTLKSSFCRNEHRFAKRSNHLVWSSILDWSIRKNGA